MTGDKIHSVSYINDPVCSLKIVSYAGIVTYLRSNCNTHDLTSFFQFIYFGIDNSTIYTNCIQVFSIWVVALLIISLLYSRKAFPPIVPPSYSDARLFQRTVLRATFSIYVSSENPEDDGPPLTVSFPWPVHLSNFFGFHLKTWNNLPSFISHLCIGNHMIFLVQFGINKHE